MKERKKVMQVGRDGYTPFLAEQTCSSLLVYNIHFARTRVTIDHSFIYPSIHSSTH